jgi:hypothetical protein
MKALRRLLAQDDDWATVWMAFISAVILTVWFLSILLLEWQ